MNPLVDKIKELQKALAKLENDIELSKDGEWKKEKDEDWENNDYKDDFKNVLKDIKVFCRDCVTNTIDCMACSLHEWKNKETE